MKLRYAPRIHFTLDNSFDEAQRINSLLNKPEVVRDLGRKPPTGNDFHGWIILDKPSGITSAHAVAKVKRLLKPQKIGHAGTLDPLASGILPLALGEATKTMPYMVDGAKEYEFTVTWGEERDTDDCRRRSQRKTSDKIPTNEEIIADLAAVHRHHSCKFRRIYSALFW